MDEQDQLQAQIQALLRARDALRNQRPTDMVAVSSVTEDIVTLSGRLAAVSGEANIPAITQPQVDALTAATAKLDTAIGASNGASEIVTAATIVASL